MADSEEKQELQRVVLGLEVQLSSLKAENRDLEEQKKQMEITLEQEMEISLDLVEKLEAEGEMLRKTTEKLENHGSVMDTIYQRKSYMTSAIEAMKKQTEAKEADFNLQRELEEKQIQAASLDFEKKRTFFAAMVVWDSTKRRALADKAETLSKTCATSTSALNNLMTEQYESLNKRL